VEKGTSENLATFRYWGSETVAEDLEFWNDGTGEDRQVNAGGSVVYANLGRWWAEGAGTLHLQTKDWVDSSFTLSGSTLTLSQSVFLVGTITITLQKQ